MTITGEWWNQNQRPILKQGGPVTADVETDDLAYDYGLYIGNFPELKADQIEALCQKLNAL